MRIILTENVRNLGISGDLVNVKAGFARNYLLPQKKAMLADPRNIKAIEHAKLIAEHKMKKARASVEALAEKLNDLKITIAHLVGEDEKIFGSVTTMEIAKALDAEGYDIDRKKIILDKPIKELGEFKIPVKLHQEVKAEITLEVVKK